MSRARAKNIQVLKYRTSTKHSLYTPYKAQSPFFRHPLLYPTCPSFLKLLFSQPFFPFHPLQDISYISTTPPPPDSQSTTLIQHTNTPTQLHRRYLFPAPNHKHLNSDTTNQANFVARRV